jgi:hypothetical protein
MCYTGANPKGDRKFRQSHRLSGPIYVDDGFFRGMAEFCVTLVLCSCVTLGFCNRTVYMLLYVMYILKLVYCFKR